MSRPTAEERACAFICEHLGLPGFRDVVQLLEEHAAAEVEAATAEIQRQLRRAIQDGGLTRCDNPACNCGGYHSRYRADAVDRANALRGAAGALRDLAAEMETEVGQ